MFNIKYFVVAVHKEDNKITRVKYRKVKEIDVPKKNYLLEPEILKTSKANIIEAINSGILIYTAYMKEENELNKQSVGSEIKVYGDDNFIRTDSNNLKEDNLGELPEF